MRQQIVPGGGTGHDSIYLGLEAMKEFTGQQDIILIHDGVEASDQRRTDHTEY